MRQHGRPQWGARRYPTLDFIGTRPHSLSLDKPFHRLAHTGKAFEAVFFTALRAARPLSSRRLRVAPN